MTLIESHFTICSGKTVDLAIKALSALARIDYDILAPAVPKIFSRLLLVRA